MKLAQTKGESPGELGIRAEELAFPEVVRENRTSWLTSTWRPSKMSALGVM